MAVCVTKKCPHCGFAYQFFQSGAQRKYGCPYKTCTRCFKAYWDTDIVEPALYGYENSYEVGKRVNKTITMLLYTPFGLLMLVLGIGLLIQKELIGLMFLALGAFALFAIGAEIKDGIAAKKRAAEIVREQQKAYDESKQRLQNTDYLIALSKHDKKAKRLLEERNNGEIEQYARRP